jgi:hypothetical protein
MTSMWIGHGWWGVYMSNPADWRERAQELRELGVRTTDAKRRQRLLELAEKLERLAEEWEPRGRPRSEAEGARE